MLATTSYILGSQHFATTVKTTNSQSPIVAKKVLGIQSRISPTPIATPTQQQKKQSHLPTIGMVVSDYTNKTGEVSALEQELGGKVTTISLYKQFGLSTNNMINPDDFSYEKSHGITLLIAWEPWNPQEGMQQTHDYLKEIANGEQDGYIQQFATAIKQYSAPVTIRFGHEMNGNWYPWGQRPTDYVQAYRRVVTVFRNAGVTNVTWMWSINANPLTNMTDYYPGDAYVDTIGIDGFNFGTTQPNSTWVSFSQIFSQPYNFVVTHYNKPVIISETASTEFGGNKAAWIQDMFTSLASFPKIQEIVWLNLLKETDWRISSSQSSFQAFKQNVL